MHERVKAKVRENGLVLGPMLLCRDHGPVRHTLSPVFDNPRFAQGLQPDFMIMFEQLRPGEKLITERIERYGEAAFRVGPAPASTPVRWMPRPPSARPSSCCWIAKLPSVPAPTARSTSWSRRAPSRQPCRRPAR